MKRNKFFGGMFILLLLATASLVSATITDYNCNGDGDGAIVINYAGLTGNEPYTLDIDGKQYGYPAHVAGFFTTNNELDPNVFFTEGVENDTTFAWTDYHIVIGMTKTFSISTSAGLVTPPGWIAAVTAPAPGTIPNDGPGWVRVIDYYQGTGSPVAIGGEGDFGFKVSFLGSVLFSTEQVPTPEPATVALLGLGALSLLRRKRGV
jgi:hypothetical protein